MQDALTQLTFSEWKRFGLVHDAKSFTKQPSKTPLAVDDSYKHDFVLGTCILARGQFLHCGNSVISRAR